MLQPHLRPSAPHCYLSLLDAPPWPRSLLSQDLCMRCLLSGVFSSLDHIVLRLLLLWDAYLVSGLEGGPSVRFCLSSQYFVLVWYIHP